MTATDSLGGRGRSSTGGCRASILLLVALASIAVSVLSWAQEGILTFSAAPSALEIAPGGRAAGRLTISNGSPREADDIEFSWAGPLEIAIDSPPEGVAVLDAFASTSVGFTMAAAATAATGDARGSFEVIYTYCIGDVCYQIVDEVPVLLRVVASPQTPAGVVGGRTDDAGDGESAAVRWQWIAFAAAAVLVLLAALQRSAGRIRIALTAALVLAGGAALWLGVSLGQHTQAQAVGAVLCTSCVGIETVETLAPRLSSEQTAAVDRLTTPVELLVFYAPWCRSCPYAEAMVGLVASRNPLVRFRLVNAEEERDLAVKHGVTRSGRTVVPAIARTDTGEIVFGAENLGKRLLELLGVGT